MPGPTDDVISRRDVDFLLYEWLHVEELTQRPRFAGHDRDVYDSVLDLYRSIALEQFLPCYQPGDIQEPAMVDGRVVLPPALRLAHSALRDSGLPSGPFDQQLGGGQLPAVIHRAGFAWLQAADNGGTGYFMLTNANAALIVEHGTPEQIRQWAEPQIAARFFGTMCMSEPQAGSSLAEVSTRAVEQPDGTFRLFGAKMWISGGDHDLAENIVHLVLARTAGAPAGASGLSLFIVPKFLVSDSGTIGERNDVVLQGLNHKMGNRAMVNTVLAFGEGTHTPGGAAGAIGYLVGQTGDGLAQMFHMMNEARIAVGASAVAVGYRSYLLARDYARSRIQGRALGAPRTEAPVPIIRHPDVRRMLLASKAYVEGALALILFVSRLLDDSRTAGTPQARAEAKALLDVLTPIAKSWPSTWCLKANDLAIQVHGGYGYTRDFPVEQLYRDNRLNPIHEGTEGMQALDLVGRRLRVDGFAGTRLVVDRMLQTVAAAPAGFTTEARTLEEAARRVERIVGLLWRDPADHALADATVLTEAIGHVVVAWLWLEQVVAADGKAGGFYDGKRLAARYFFGHEIPIALAQLDVVESRSHLLVDLDETVL